MTDRHENPRDRQGGLLPGDRVAHPQTRHRLITLHPQHRRVGHKGDLLIGPGPLEHDARRAELLPAVHQGHAAREPGQKGGFLHRRVPTTDHRDVLIFEEKPITSRTRTHPTPQQLLLPGHPQIPRRGTHRQNHRPRPHRMALRRRHRLDRPAQRHRLHVLHPQIRPKPQRLLTHLTHQLRTRDAITKTGEILHLGSRHQRSTKRNPLKHHRRQLRPRRIQRRGVPSRTRTNDDHVVDAGVSHGRHSTASQ